MSRRFTVINESFICKNCGQNVNPHQGGSCRNHCSHCLVSLHVDVNPGDRAAGCEGLMKPIKIELKSGKSIIHFECLKCGFQGKNKVAEDDNFGTQLSIMAGTYRLIRD